MANKIKKVYVVHHSHTDIGYTDLQERVMYVQADYIKTVLAIMKKTEYKDFRWNCETYYCVEQFLDMASESEKEEFFALVRDGKIGISGTYLNFTDLLDSDIYKERLGEMIERFQEHGTKVKTAMTADINGISMGQRDAMLRHGIEFLFTNIHCHHGMYPLYQNQTPYFWENKEGKRLLVWNGEHYNLGNALGIKPNKHNTYFGSNYFGNREDFSEDVEILHQNLTQYLELCEEHQYNYSFLISSVSGEFSDNAPPNPQILETINAFNKLYGEQVTLQMVSLQELYENIREELQNAPVYHGDLTDWWANGVGSTPYAVKHYKEAVRKYHLCERLDSQMAQNYPDLTKTAQDNLLLYAEHTWGHSGTITDPYDTLVTNLDMRKNSYASKAHESVSKMLIRTAAKIGDVLRYYKTEGKVLAVNPTDLSCDMPVEFYIESPFMKKALIKNADGKEIICQASKHPRGILISFVDHFESREKKEYTYSELPEDKELMNSRVVYSGSEGVKDIVNDYDNITYRLPYEFQNKWFHLSYAPGEGIRSFINKTNGESLLREDCVPFFTPIYEVTELGAGRKDRSFRAYDERRLLGRNIRGKHAKVHIGRLLSINCLEKGDVFTLLELNYELPGTSAAKVLIKLFEAIPRIEYKLQLAKNNSDNIESIYMPMSLGSDTVWLEKGAEPFRPGIDQIPGTCMEYYMSDEGAAIIGTNQSILIQSLDVPLIAMGELKHHPIRLCDNKEENNTRPLYSWVMNNTWETNFKMDLGGYGEFCYTLTLSPETVPEQAFHKMKEQALGIYTLMLV